MRIERNNVLRMYENAKQTAKQEAVPQSSDVNGKQDRVSFSADATQKAPIGRMAQGVAADIEMTAASSQRLAQITQEVNSGSYYVSTDKLVGSIIDVFG